MQNTIGFTAALDLQSFMGLGDTGVLTTNLAAFSGLAANASNAYLASIDTSALGVFSATYTLNVAGDQNIFGAGARVPLLLTFNGTVYALTDGEVPEPATAWLLLLGMRGLCRRRK